MRGISMVMAQGFLLREILAQRSLLRRAFTALGDPARCAAWCTGREKPQHQVFLRGLGPVTPMGVRMAGLLARLQQRVEFLLGRPIRGVIPLRCRRVRGLAVEVGGRWMRSSVTVDLYPFGAGIIRMAFPLPNDVTVKELVSFMRGDGGNVRWHGATIRRRDFFIKLHRLVLDSLFSESRDSRGRDPLQPLQCYVYLAGVDDGGIEGVTRVLTALTFRIFSPKEADGKDAEILTGARWGVRRHEHILLTKRGAVVVSPILAGSSGREARKRLRGMLEWLGGLAQLQAAWLDAVPLTFEAAPLIPQEVLEDLLVTLTVPLNPELLLGQAAQSLLPSAAWRSAYRVYARSFSLQRRWRTAWHATLQLAQGTIAVSCGNLIKRLLRLHPRTLTLTLRSFARIERGPFSISDLQITYQLSEEAALVLRALLQAYINDVRNPRRREKLGERSRRELGEMTGLGRAIYGRKGMRRDPISELSQRGLVISRQGKSVGRTGRTLFACLNLSNPEVLKLLARIDPSLLN